MNLQPLADRVIVKPKLDPVTTTQAGLIVQQADRDDIQFAEVVAIGPDVQDVAIGDNALVMESQSVDLIVDGNKFWSFHEQQILAVQ